MREAWPWATAAALGAFHGANPAMGWLFAVALGMQEQRERAVTSALLPITIGHAAAIVAVLLLLTFGGLALPVGVVRWCAALLLVAFGLLRLARPRAHFRWVGMRVGFADLVLWSFLMATAHGAGLMLAPVLLHQTGRGLAVIGVHTATMLLVMASVALLVYRVLGVGVLRRAWVNLDLVWAVALIGAGVATLLL